MCLILFISYCILLCKSRTLRLIKRLVNLIKNFLFISGMCFYKSYKTPKCVATVFPKSDFLPKCQEISKLVRTLRYVSKFFKISQKQTTVGKIFVTSGWTISQGALHLAHFFFLSVNGARIDANFMVSIANFDQCVLFFKWSHSSKVVIIQVANVYLQRHQRSRGIHYVS